MRNQQIIDRLKKKPLPAESLAKQIAADQRVWIEVMASISGAVGVSKIDTCATWADAAVERYNERWKS
jgi:hypothetical protein